MKKNLVFIFFGAIFIISCKDDKAIPKPPARESYWIINGDTFITKGQAVNIGKTISNLNSGDSITGFGISFYFGEGLPNYGTWEIAQRKDSINQDPGLVHISFNYKVKNYNYPTNQYYITGRDSSGKAQLILSPTWFVNRYNSEDSIKIQGTFNEP